MQTPTIVKQTKDYMLVKIPLPTRASAVIPQPSKIAVESRAEKRLWEHLQEAKQDVKNGMVITEPSLKKALRRYDKQQWD